MKRKIYINWKVWIWTGVILIILFIILNFVLPLPKLFPVLGDEKDWLNVWVQIIIALLPIIVGSIQQKSYNDEENEKEYQRNILRDKIANARNHYSDLKNIVENNISVLSFINFKKLIQQIDCNTCTNSLLTSNICDYQAKISDAKTKTELFLAINYPDLEVLVYKAAIAEFVKIYDKILPAFIGYLNSVDQNLHKNKANIDTFMPIAKEDDKLILSLKKIEGNNLNYELKARFNAILDTQQSNMDKLSHALNIASKALLNNEHSKINVLETELEKSK